MKEAQNLLEASKPTLHGTHVAFPLVVLNCPSKSRETIPLSATSKVVFWVT